MVRLNSDVVVEATEVNQNQLEFQMPLLSTIESSVITVEVSVD